MKDEIEAKKKEELEAVDGDAKKIDFNVERDCYIPDVQKFTFDLETVNRNSKGEIIQ